MSPSVLIFYIVDGVKVVLYNPQNDGFHFTKRRVYFLRGFHTPLFFALGSDSAPGSEFALGFGSAFLFVLSRCFIRFASVFRSFLLPFCLFFHFFVVGLHFFLILFGGFDFVRTFAARNSVWSSAPDCIPGSVAPFAISFLRA